LSTPSLSPHKAFPRHNINAGFHDRTNFDSISLEDFFLQIDGSDQTDVDFLGVHTSGFITEGTVGSRVGSTDGSRTSSLSLGLPSPRLPSSNPPREKHTSNGLLPLHIASKFGFTSIIEVLLENGADLNLADSQGLTALHYAVEGSHIDSIKVLLYWGAEPLMTDLSGLNVLQLAVINGDCNVVALLMDHGVDPNIASLCV
jgi:ankyrin repeat protein